MPAATIRVRVPFVDVDSTQRIHYTAWLRFMEVAEHHLMREIGFSYATVLLDQAYPRVRLECDFYGAIQYDDELDVEARIERVGRSSWTVAFVGRHIGAPADAEPVATGKMTIVCMDPATQRSRPLPDDLRSALSAGLPTEAQPRSFDQPCLWYNAGERPGGTAMATVEPIAQQAMRAFTSRSLRSRRMRRLLAIPLLYRVLIANSVVILIGATVGTYLATMLQGDSRPYILVGFVFTGLLLSVIINFALLKFALYPLTHLRDTMRLVQDGDLSCQAPVTGQDPDADQLATSFNTMLAAIEDLAKSRATQILHAQEQERKRIARELHDETSQLLTSLLIGLKVLEESTPDETVRSRVADIRALAHQTLRAVRNLSIDLRPSALDDLGLLPALRWYIKEYQQKCGIEVEFGASGLKERLPAETETALYRIIQESLTNTAKHARATKVNITMAEEDGMIHARICDDGRGFDAQTVLRTPWQDRGLGLAGMTERASLLNGTVDIHSEPGSGTNIDVKIPVTRAPQMGPAIMASEMASA